MKGVGLNKATALVLVALLVGTLLPTFSGVASAAGYDNSLRTVAQAGDTIEPAADPDAPAEDAAQETPGLNQTAQDTCDKEVGALSWGICPIIDLVARMGRYIGDLLIGLLEFDPVITQLSEQGDTSRALYNAWSVFRNIANSALVIAFLIIIYLILTGSKAYAVQRMLPRLAVAAVGIQLSFVVSALMVDIGNVLGVGIAELFNGINQSVIDGIDPELRTSLFRGSRLETTSATANTIGGSIAAIITLPIALIFLLTFMVSTAFPPAMVILVTGVIGLFVALLILALRQLGIVVLIVTSPLSFLLAIFPGTQQLFKEWSDNLIKLILIYPLVVLLFSISGLLSSLALLTSGQSQLNQFVASLLPVITLFLVPYLFRFAGRIFRGAGGMLSGSGKSLSNSLLGDYKDPGSFRYQHRLKSFNSRLDRSRMQSSKLPIVGKGLRYLGKNTSQRGIASWGKGRGGALPFIQPARLQAMTYQMGGGLLEGLFSKDYPGALMLASMGDNPFDSMDGTEDHKQSTINDNLWALNEIKQVRHSPPMMAALADVAAEHTGGHFDRGLDYLYGIGRQYHDGSVPEAAGQAFFEQYKARVKGVQRHIGAYSWDDIKAATAEPTGNSRQVFEYAYGTSGETGLMSDGSVGVVAPGATATQQAKMQKSLLDVASGTLTEQQSEGSWKAAARALSNPTIINKAKDLSTPENRTFRTSVDSVLGKAASIQQQMRETRLAHGTKDASDEEVLSSFYGKSGNEIRAIRQFLAKANDAREQLGYNHKDVHDVTKPKSTYDPSSPMKSGPDPTSHSGG